MQIMTMRVLLATVLALGAGQVFAHEEFRVIGTLTENQDSRIEVQSRDGKMTLIRLDRQTKNYPGHEERRCDRAGDR